VADLKIEEALVDGERRTVEAGLRPVRYLATLIGANDDEGLAPFRASLCGLAPGVYEGVRRRGQEATAPGIGHATLCGRGADPRPVSSHHGH
jgi:hypothetical protein